MRSRFIVYGVLACLTVASYDEAAYGQERTNDTDAMIERLKNAQAQNIAALASGRMSFEVTYKPTEKAPELLIRGDATWNTKGTLLVYRIKDEGFVVLPKPVNEPAKQDPDRLHHLLITGRLLFLYNDRTNTLFKYDLDAPGPKETPAGFNFFLVTPLENWLRHLAPFHEHGRLWRDCIGPPAIGRDTKSTCSLNFNHDKTRVTQKITQPDSSISEITFDLSQGGNVVNYQYSPANKLIHSKSATYKWKTTKNGPHVIDTYTFHRNHNQSNTNLDIYTLKVTNVLLGDVDDDKVSLNTLLSQLPRNPDFMDVGMGKKFYLNGFDNHTVDDRP